MTSLDRYHSLQRAALIVMIVVIVVVAGLTMWSLGPVWRDHAVRRALVEEQSPSFWWLPSWRREYSLRKKLLDPVTVEFVETPLGDVLQFLKEYTGTPFILDEASLNQIGVTRETPVTIHGVNTRLVSLLKPLLDGMEAAYVVERSAILITSRPHAEQKPTWTVEKTKSDFEKEKAAEDKIRLQLARSITLQFKDAYLFEVINDLAERTGLIIVYERTWMIDSVASDATLTTLEVQDRPLGEALTEWLDRMNSRYVIESGMLVFRAKSEGGDKSDE